MNYVDIALIGIIIIAMIVGFFQGFTRSLLSLAGTLLALLAGILLAQTVANMLGGLFGLKDALGNAFAGMFKSELLNTPINLSDSEAIAVALQSLGLPDLLIPYMATAVAAVAPAGSSEITLAQYIGPMLANALLVVVSFILIFLIVRLIVKILEKFLKLLFSSPIMRTADRVLGAGFGIIKAYIVVCVLFIFLGLVLYMPFFEPLKTTLEESSLGLTLYQNNILLQLLAKAVPSIFG